MIYIYIYIYARALVRTVFGRPKAGMFPGGTGRYPGAGPTSFHPVLRALAGSGIPELAGHG